ncbi:MAG: helix-turn-helix transcriptional regulator [Flavobacteriales bacterium]|nr:helix-turn-helix transcriptional regulator [Flavobacteriales bacterium]
MSKPLTNKEREVLECVLKGFSNQEIANELAVSVNTVKTHLRKIFYKNSVSSRQQLIVKKLSVD